MPKIRKNCAYRRVERAYTRISKYRKKAYVRARPHSVITKYVSGDQTTKFPVQLDLVATVDFQLRHNAMEAARQTSNRVLEKQIGKNQYFMKLCKYPHHILRENPLAAGAGADRMSTGMSRSFGKLISSAAQIKEGDRIFTISVPTQFVDKAKLALKRASYKLPFSYRIVITQNKSPVPKIVA